MALEIERRLSVEGQLARAHLLAAAVRQGYLVVVEQGFTVR